MTFDTDLQFVLKWEGDKYTDDPDDAGHGTKYGITQSVYDPWRMARSFPKRSVAEIDIDEVAAIYHGKFWLLSHCKELPERLASVQFNTAVQRGPENAIRMLQSAVGTISDGRWGDNTVKATQACEQNIALARYFDLWDKHITSRVDGDPTQAKFENGWRNRIDALKNYVGVA